ncbi:putative multi antimicrobial extrusion protein [Medicago truncatula]|uniref:Protein DETOXIFICATION n=1 Tax=Medicago truncatula TaxID=3880 RepID=G7JJS3_MEDTR|nr:protein DETOXIFICATION 46, chloroplastic [Medicago truncatula]AES89226.1 MATE efflux family protein [Medicago truncatula]RHN61356.1 putative multi antimicrobial extrusion protein [Medicago truncatula]
MTLKLQLHFHHISPFKILNLTPPSHSPLLFHAPNDTFTISSKLFHVASKRRSVRILNARVVGSNELTDESDDEECYEEMGEKKELAEKSVWNQMKEIVKFTGPAMGLWLCDPLMSLIDTAVVGQGSSTELAALGPATVVCDYMTLTFMFLSVVTSNIIATALAKQDREDVQHHLSILLFIGLACGLMMLLSTKLFGAATLAAFTGPKNAHVVPAANTYVQIRALSWPALLVGWVAQSASLGMKDSWGPLKALAAASVINGIGDILLCSCLGYGIAGAAWATMVSQVVTAYMMIQTLNKRGYNAFAFSIPSMKEFLTILSLAAPVYLTSISKVAFFSLLIYVATSMGTQTMAAHQVMIQIYMACTVWGEPLCQTAQSFMPELMYGVNRSLPKARLLLRSLVIIGAILGLLLGIVGTSLIWLFPYIFTSDQMVIQKMHRTLIPFFVALAVTAPTRSLEGTLLAGQDLRFFSLSTCGCFCVSALVLLIFSRYGLQGCWFTLAGFQWARFSVALLRLIFPNGILYSKRPV